MRESKKGTVSVIGGKKMTPQCSLQLASKLKPYAPLRNRNMMIFKVYDGEGNSEREVEVDRECWRKKSCVQEWQRTRV